MRQQAGERAGDPFADADFMDRTAKLLAVLSTDNDAEADAAWRKLRSHLAHRGVAFTDLANRLRGEGLPRAVEGGSWRSAELERELAILRLSQGEREAALHLARAEARLAAEQVALLAVEAEGLRQELVLARWVSRCSSAIAIVVTLGSAALAGWLFSGREVANLVPAGIPPPRAESGPPATPPSALPPAPPGTELPRFQAGAAPGAGHRTFSWQQENPQPTPGSGIRRGVVVADDAALLAEAAPGALVRAVLKRGTPVLILRNLDRAGFAWSLVRTETAEGYVTSTALAYAR